MTLTERARELRPYIEKAAALLDDEDAANAPELFPTWQSGVEYEAGQKINYGGVVYKVLQAHTAQSDWAPEGAASLFAQVLTNEDGTPTEWVQPDSTNAYMSGDQVIYNGTVYESLIDNNVWSPDAYPSGWYKIE